MEEFFKDAIETIELRSGQKVRQFYLVDAIPVTSTTTHQLDSLHSEDSLRDGILEGVFKSDLPRRDWGDVDELWLYWATLSGGDSVFLIELVPVRLYSRGTFVRFAPTEVDITELNDVYPKIRKIF